MGPLTRCCCYTGWFLHFEKYGFRAVISVTVFGLILLREYNVSKADGATWQVSAGPLTAGVAGAGRLVLDEYVENFGFRKAPSCN